MSSAFTSVGLSAVLWGATDRLSFSVTSYGAVGNGVTNDTAAIKAALAAAAAVDGICLFPSGNYVFSDLPLYPNVWWRGMGKGRTVLTWKHNGASASPPGFDMSGYTPGDVLPDVGNLQCGICVQDPVALTDQPASGYSGIRISDMTINGGGGTFNNMNPLVNPDYSFDTLSGMGTTNMVLENVEIIEAAPEIDLSLRDGILRRSSNLGLMRCAGTVVSRCNFRVAAYDSVAIRGYEATDITFIECDFGPGIRSSDQTEYGAGRVTFINCTGWNNWSGRAAGYAYFTGATYTYAAGVGTITKPGAFSDYRTTVPVGGNPFVAGDKIQIMAGFTRQVLTVTGCPDSNTITTTGGPAANFSGVAGYQYGSGKTVVQAYGSHTHYVHGGFDIRTIGGRYTNSTAVGGSCCTAFGDANGSDNRPYTRAVFRDVQMAASNISNGLFLLGPASSPAFPHIVSAVAERCTIECAGTAGNVVQVITEDYATPNTSVTLRDCDLRQMSTGGSAGNVIVARYCNHLVVEGGTITKLNSNTGHGIVLTGCDNYQINNVTWFGTGTGSPIMILLYKGSANHQCRGGIVEGNVVPIDFTLGTAGPGWNYFLFPATDPIDAITIRNNDLGQMTHPLCSFVGGFLTTLIGQAAPGTITDNVYPLGSGLGTWSNPGNVKISGNIGRYVKDHGSGVGTVLSGNSSVTISHGLASDATAGQWLTYIAKHLKITPTSPLKTAASWAISSVTQTQFTLTTYNSAGVATSVGADFTFAWQAGLEDA